MGLIAATKPIRISFNMLSCAVLFCWAGVQPRETLSGFFGRRAQYSKYKGMCFWRFGAAVIDMLHPHEPDHCHDTYCCESSMRKGLYGTD